MKIVVSQIGLDHDDVQSPMSWVSATYQRIWVVIRAVVPFAQLLFAGCDTSESGDPSDSMMSADNSAILVAVIVEGPDNRNVYVGAVPEVPTGELDYSSFLEFGSVDAFYPRWLRIRLGPRVVADEHDSP